MNEQIEIEGPTFFAISKKEGVEKFMIGLGKNGRHLTFVAKGNKNTYDVHLTFEKPKKKYLPLLELPKPIVHELLEKLQSTMIMLYNKYWTRSRMNVGKMKKYKMILSSINGNNEIKDEFIVEVIKDKKYSFKRKMHKENLEKMFFEPHEALACDGTAFLVFQSKKRSLLNKGIAIKNSNGKGHFWLISNKNLRDFSSDLVISFRQMLGEAEFPLKEDILGRFDKLIKKRHPKSIMI